MQRFFNEGSPVRFDDCVIIYRHIYDREEPERRHRDHDNIETNFVTDIVALYVMTDDAPLRCRHYYCSAAGSTERTEVYVVPEQDFMRWYEAEKNFPDEGVKLHAQTTFGKKSYPKTGVNSRSDLSTRPEMRKSSVSQGKSRLRIDPI